VATLRQLLDACEAELQAHLEPNEHVLATGRGEDITQGGGPERGGAAWTYVMVTDRRLHWVPHADLRLNASLDLDDVTAAIEHMKAHRYAIRLDHRDITRSFLVPAHRFLWFKWGNAVSRVSVARTRLAFSRRDTAVARALRDQLSSRGVL
jgi:hypothetical protein